MISTLGRFYRKVIKTKLEYEIKGKISEDQSRFTVRKGCIDHIYTVQHLLERKKGEKFTFIDLKKAYDTVSRKGLWTALNEIGIQNKLKEVVNNLYRNNKISIKIGYKLTNSFQTTKGLLQRCATSLTLFKIFLEQYLKNWKRKSEGMGVPVKDRHLYTLSFADDQVVVTQDSEDLSFMVRKLREEYSKTGLEINEKQSIW